MNIREIEKDEVILLYDLVSELSDYHNKISENFKGIYPRRNISDTIKKFEVQIEAGNSRIAVIEDNEICGFCKVDINGKEGKLDYLIVRKAYRGKGYGGKLMEWAMNIFEQNNVLYAEVKVINDNPARHLYEKFGFCTESYILRKNM